MQIIKVHFGGSKPTENEYTKRADGMAEVWLYRDIHEEKDADGNSDFVADGVFFTTMLDEAEVLAQKDSYFVDDSDPTTEELAQMAYVNSELALALLEVE